MTRGFIQPGALWAVVLSIAACGGPKAEKGDAAAVAPAASAAAQSAATTDPRVAIADTNRITGNPDAKVWLIMASDFQCPACKYWHDSQSAEIMRDYVANGKVRFAYTNFPLDQLHPNARAASEAAMCVAAQGKFWPYHETLFAKQTEWAPLPDPIPAFRQMALAAGVDTVVWNQCLADDVMLPLIDGDQSRGRANGVDQTPYFFVGEQRVGGAIPAARLRPMIDAAIAKAGETSR